jgi:4-carboxymuconolactone decarboxylase
MKQHIRMAAILEREGRLFLVREDEGSPWQLPGGALPLENDDIDAEMDQILTRHGVMAPAIEEDFLQTHYFPADDGQIVFNVYAATEWTGEPAAVNGHGAWFGMESVESLQMDEGERGALLEALGLRAPVDHTDEILAALGGEAPTPLPPPQRSPESGSATHPRRDAGLDVMRTLRGGGDPIPGFEAMQKTQPEIAGDVVDFALGEVWSHPALDRKTRSLQVVAMLCAMGRTGGPLTSHINGALNHGATPEQVVQTLRMVAVYAGFPAALEAWPVMERVFEQRGIPRPGRLQ